MTKLSDLRQVSVDRVKDIVQMPGGRGDVGMAPGHFVTNWTFPRQLMSLLHLLSRMVNIHTCVSQSSAKPDLAGEGLYLGSFVQERSPCNFLQLVSAHSAVELSHSVDFTDLYTNLCIELNG